MRDAKQTQTLFFVKGPVPSEKELAAAKALGTKCFRNANHYSTPPKDGCKAAGAVPENYRKAKNVEVIAQATEPAKK